MHISKSLIFYIFFLFSAISLFAASEKIHITPQKEIEILRSLDIDPSFIDDIHYIQTKENIDQLKKIYFLKTLKRGSLFMPNLQELLDESDIPNTFLYMAMVESKFLADSKSHKHAAGLWQFMPATAREYNLKQNRHIDERLDPIKSTKAAIEYLKYLHGRFKKWYLAAMAYNCGEGRLAQAIKKAGTDDLAVLLDEQEAYLPRETRNYIQRIIVAALLAHDKHIIKENNKNHLFGYCSSKKLTKLYFKGGQSLQSIAVKIGVPYKKLKACNPHLIRQKLPPDPKKMYYVYLPEDLAQKAEKKIKNSGEAFTYYVQPNDTLFLISKRFNIKMSALKMLNPQLNKQKILKIGMPITILGKPPKSLPRQPKKETRDQVVTITLDQNMSIYALSAKYNNKIETLKRLNPDIPDKLQKGMHLKVIQEVNLTAQTQPARFKTFPIAADRNLTQKESNTTDQNKTITPDTNTTRTAKNSEQNSTGTQQAKHITFRTITHRIVEGDTFETIAKEFNLTVKDLLKPGNVMIFKIKKKSTQNKAYEDQNNTQQNRPAPVL